jgi:hypothetical protein
VEKKQRVRLHLVRSGVKFSSSLHAKPFASDLRRPREMKRLELVLLLMLVTAVATGCQSGKWRLRGARCRPGMTMPTYAQTSVPPPAAAPCNTAYPSPGYPPTGYPAAGYPSPGFVPGGNVQGGYVQGGYVQGDGIMPGETITSENAGEVFPTNPIEEGQTQRLQRPYFDSPVVEGEGGNVITIPGPETGPLPNS